MSDDKLWVDNLVSETVSSGCLKKTASAQVRQETPIDDRPLMTSEEIRLAAMDFDTVGQVMPRNVQAGLQRLYPQMSDADFGKIRKAYWSPVFEGRERVAADKAETVFYGKDDLNGIVDDLMELSVRGYQEVDLAKVAVEKYNVDEPMLQNELIARAVIDQPLGHRDPSEKYLSDPNLGLAHPHTADPGMVEMAGGEMLTIKVKDGLLFFSNENMVSSRMADEIARANGFAYAEQLVQKFRGKTFEIDSDSLEIQGYEKTATDSVGEQKLYELKNFDQGNHTFDIVSVYDNGGKTADRYTVVVGEMVNGNNVDRFEILLSEDALSPQGVNMIGDTGTGGGEPIEFEDLPEQVQKAVNRRLQELRTEGALKQAADPAMVGNVVYVRIPRSVPAMGSPLPTFAHGTITSVEGNRVKIQKDNGEEIEANVSDVTEVEPEYYVEGKTAADPAPTTTQAPTQQAPAAPVQTQEPDTKSVEELVRRRIEFEGKQAEINNQVEKLRSALMSSILPLQQQVKAEEPVLVEALKTLDDMSIMVDGWKALVSKAFDKETPKYKDIVAKINEVAEEEVIPRISNLIKQLMGMSKYVTVTHTPERLMLREIKPQKASSLDGWNFGKEAAPVTQKLKEWWAQIVGWFKRDFTPELEKVEQGIDEINEYLNVLASPASEAVAPAQASLKRKAVLPIPKNFPVQPLKPGQPSEDKATCGICGLSWDDAIITSMTPAPAGRCPFEYFHEDSDYDDKEASLKRKAASYWPNDDDGKLKF